MKIWLIRHGATVANERCLYCGSTDLPLSESGREELRNMRRGEICAERYITSGMARCDETLTILFGDVRRETIPGLREIDFGAFEMRGYEELKDDPAYRTWLAGDNEKNVPPGGESGEQMKAQALAAFEGVVSDGRSAVIVTHGGVIAAVMERLFPEEHRGRYDWQPRPGAGYELDMDPTGRRASYREWKGEEIEMSGDWRNKKPEECNYSFTQNRACEFFPCHQTDKPEDFNCLFCYCPLYTLGSKCGGNFRYLENGHKDCSNCMVPHRRSSYSYVISKYPELAELAKKNR
jgi:alpha-ribazole phosphatase